MYFGVIGENKSLVESAMQFLHPSHFSFVDDHIIIFDTPYTERLQDCAVIIKRGAIYAYNEQDKIVTSSLIGTKEKSFAMELKKNNKNIKRFKLVELIHSDHDIKTSGQEIIKINETHFGLVQGYQNISRYEIIDFEKPSSGMGIGMMPSKLALSLINIGVGNFESIHTSLESTKELTIRDPFCGFGTTNFLANSLGYHTIGSDINITQAKQNLKRRLHQSVCQNKKISFVKQDATTVFDNPLMRYADIIVSEGWLGPIVNRRTHSNEVLQYSQQVCGLYKKFFSELSSLLLNYKKPLSLVLTVPYRLRHDITISSEILSHIQQKGRNGVVLDNPYQREHQLVARDILVAHYQ